MLNHRYIATQNAVSVKLKLIMSFSVIRKHFATSFFNYHASESVEERFALSSVELILRKLLISSFENKMAFYFANYRKRIASLFLI